MEKKTVRNKVFEKIEECMSTLYSDSEICEDSHFVNDLGFDSITLVQLIIELEELFKIEMDDAEYENIITVSKMVDYIYDKIHKGEKNEGLIE